MLKIGVIGLGSIRRNHVRMCSEIENVDLVGVADVNKETAKNIAKRFGKLITIASKRISNFTERIKNVGVIFAFGIIRDIDILRHPSGEIKSVYGKAGKFNKNIDREDYANVILNFENGIRGIVVFSFGVIFGNRIYNIITPMKERHV